MINHGPQIEHELESHSHRAVLDLVLDGWGEPLLWEAGGPPSYDDPGYLSWYQSGRGHNTVLVDDRELSTDRRVSVDPLIDTGYVWILAALQIITGPSPYGVHLVGIVVYVGAAVLLYRAVRSAFGVPAALIGLGLLLFLPLYLIRAMGAGDVKLLAMVGAFLGPGETFHAALATIVAGGMLSILFVLVRGTALRMLRNLTSFLQLGFLCALSGTAPSLAITADASAGKLPYGVAIAVGGLVTFPACALMQGFGLGL